MRSNLYVARPLRNAQELLDWAKGVGIPTTLTADDVHVTLVHSRAAVEWADAPDTATTLTVPVQESTRTLALFGENHDVLVLRFDSQDLQDRYQQLRDIGASSDFSEYRPHVTLSYDAAGFDMADITPFEGALEFGPEVFNEIDDGWKERVLALKSFAGALIPRWLARYPASHNTVVGRLPAPSSNEGSPMSTKAFASLAKIFKSADPGLLADLEQIADYTDGDGKNKVPSATEMGSESRVIPMQGGSATGEVARNGSMAPQMGIQELYQQFAGRLGNMEKSMKALIEGIAKAGDSEKDDENPFEKAEKAVRKSKLAVRKAEDEDDADDKDDAFEKAERAIVAAKAAVQKAEEGADSDEDDERVEKAAKALKTVKSSLKAARDAVVKAKADAVVKAEADAAAAAAAATATPVVAAPTVADLAKSHETLSEQLGVVTKSLGDVMAAVQAKAAVPAAVAAGLIAAPVVAKAATPELVTAVEDALDAAELPTGALMKGHSLLLRLRAVNDGKLAREVFDAELEKAPADVRAVFANA